MLCPSIPIVRSRFRSLRHNIGKKSAPLCWQMLWWAIGKAGKTLFCPTHIASNLCWQWERPFGSKDTSALDYWKPSIWTCRLEHFAIQNKILSFPNHMVMAITMATFHPIRLWNASLAIVQALTKIRISLSMLPSIIGIGWRQIGKINFLSLTCASSHLPEFMGTFFHNWI